MKKFYLLALALGAAASTAQAQLVFNSFDSDISALKDNDGTLVSDDGAWLWDSAAGVGGTSGRIGFGTPNNRDFAVYNDGATITKDYTTIYAASLFFLTDSTIGTNIAEVQTGFVRSAGSNFAGGGSSLEGYLRKDSGAGSTVYLQLVQDNVDVTAPTATFSLAPNTWYELQTTMDLASDALVDTASVSLFARGADGTDSRTLIATVSANNFGLGDGGFNAASLFGALAGGNNTGTDILAFDNFSVSAIPEPSTYAAIFGFIGLAALCMRRRQK